MSAKILGAIALCLIVCVSDAKSANPCLGNAVSRTSDSYQITVDDKTVIRKLEPSFFGFNLEWLQFQLGFWDKQHGKVNPYVIELLQSFPGAVYRYPGGTGSNHFNWRDATGNLDSRATRKFADWLDPMRIQFGPKEYLELVRDVKGEAWYVSNLFGKKGTELSTDEMVKSAGELAAFMRTQRELGLPAVSRWELGNELDREDVRWPPSKLATKALAVAREIRQQDPASRFLIALQEYPAMERQGYSAAEYNKAVANSMKAYVDEFAIHLYYDDKPSGITIDKQMAATCRALDNARVAGVKNPAIWITEQAFVPKGAWETPDWKRLWPQTASLQAAINVADLMVTAVQEPTIQGAMIHALHGTDGPWPLFHSIAKNGKYHPSTVMVALRMLRENMLPEVLQTASQSANVSGYNGGYDMRAIVMADPARQHYAVWAINRSPDQSVVKLNISTLRSNKMRAKQVVLSDDQLQANNYLDSKRLQAKPEQVELTFDQTGGVNVTLPPYSITTYDFHK